MQPMKHTFLLLQCLGVWRPVHWPPGLKTNIYYCYTFFIMLIVWTLLFSASVEMVNTMNDIEAFTNRSFMLLTLVADGAKAIHILIKRSEIIALTNTLQQDPFRPRNEEELAIKHKFEKWIRSTTLRYWTLVGFTLLAVIMRSLVEGLPQRLLPYESWIPFDYYESLLFYSIAYVHQVIALVVVSGIGICFDTLVSGFMLQTCGQLHILKHRFHEMPQTLLDYHQIINSGNKLNLLISDFESKLLSQCVAHHIGIFKFAKASNDLFSIMIFVQYTISIVVLCVSVFRLSSNVLFSPGFTAVFIYALCMGVQIFIYCYYGCEVTFESLTVADAIYAINWDSMSIKAQRNLLTVMVRTLRPIEFTSGHILTLNLDYFNSLLKLAYSAYNVLQQSSN